MDEHAWAALYQVLKALGFGRPTPNFEVTGPDGKPIATVTLAWPEQRTALLLDTAVPPALKKAGWDTLTLPGRQLAELATVLSGLEQLRFAQRLTVSRDGAGATTSNTEQKMLNALLRVGMPDPARDLEFRDDTGRLVTVPDFCWDVVNGVEVKIALEVDGFYFHGGADLSARLDALAAGAADDGAQLLADAAADPDKHKALLADRRAKVATDAAKRRFLTARGWQVFVVSDAEIDAGDAPRVAAEVRAALDAALAGR